MEEYEPTPAGIGWRAFGANIAKFSCKDSYENTRDNCLDLLPDLLDGCLIAVLSFRLDCRWFVGNDEMAPVRAADKAVTGASEAIRATAFIDMMDMQRQYIDLGTVWAHGNIDSGL
jgi:hypothetical protein